MTEDQLNSGWRELHSAVEPDRSYYTWLSPGGKFFIDQFHKENGRYTDKFRFIAQVNKPELWELSSYEEVFDTLDDAIEHYNKNFKEYDKGTNSDN